MNRKALSSVVATVMIILLTMSAAAIIYAVAVPFVRDGLESSTECVDFQEHYKFKEEVGLTSGTNCLLSNDDLLISVSAQNNPEAASGVEGFNLVLFREGSSDVLAVKAGASIPNLASSSGGAFELPGPGETRTYRYGDNVNDGSADDYQFAELTPILEGGKICERRSDRIAIRRCS